VEWWALSTVRVGATLKFARRKPVPAAAPAPDVRFSVRAPASVVLKRQIIETFPLRNYVYFEESSAQFSSRYERLTRAQAAAFREEQLQERYPARPTGRSQRQMAVYYNILNVMGDRLRRNPGTTITLRGAAVKDRQLGAVRAEVVKRYLVDAFGIDGGRIATGERDEPRMPLGRTDEELLMLRAETQRVEIWSESPEMLVQIGEGKGEGFMLKPVQIEGEEAGLDSVVFFVSGADTLTSWSLEITEVAGTDPKNARLMPETAKRFGPFTRARETIPASVLLGGRTQGEYTAVMTGQIRRSGPQERAGALIRRQAAFRLFCKKDGVLVTSRFGILFDIDQARAVSSYDKFLNETVAPLIADSSIVFIRGRTDIITDEVYNLKLSQGRAEGVLRSLEASVGRSGRRGVKFMPSWSGEDPRQAPFGNTFPEERNYNRTVIIDILPE
jgi:outer membrane protein OmpA-like peptidoglycan-associated protein